MKLLSTRTFVLGTVFAVIMLFLAGVRVWQVLHVEQVMHCKRRQFKCHRRRWMSHKRRIQFQSIR